MGLYHAFAEPDLDYCASVWSTATKKLRDTLGVVQRDAVRALVDYDPAGKVRDLFGQLNVVDVQMRWRIQDAVWLYRMLESEKFLPRYLKYLLVFKESRRVFERH